MGICTCRIPNYIIMPMEINTETHPTYLSTLELDVYLQMILQILADSGQRHHRLNPGLL